MNCIAIVVGQLLFSALPPSGIPQSGISTKKGGVEEDPLVRTIHGRVREHIFDVLLEKRPFDPKRHRVTKQPDGRSWIDGRPPIGVESLRLPHNELSRFEVKVDRRPWSVPIGLWRDCFEPHLGIYSGVNGNPNHDNMTASLSRDGRTMTISMEGSDGAGGYVVTWKIRHHGKSTRFVGE